MRTQTTGIKEYAIAIIIAFLVIGGIWLIVKSNPRTSDDPVKTSAYARQYEQAKTQIAILRAEGDLKSDSIKGLQVQIGWKDVELNRSETKIRDLTNRILAVSSHRGAEGAPTVWTEAINNKLMDCDSLAYELKFQYLDRAAERAALADSLNMFYEALLDNKDSVIKQLEAVDTLSFTELAKAQADRDEARKEAKKAQRKAGIGWIAAAVMGGIAILSNLFQ